MITAVLLLVCLVLAGAVVALAVAVRRLVARVEQLAAAAPVEEVAQRPSRHHGDLPARAGFETGASAPSSTSEERDYVITRLGSEAEVEQPAPTMEARLFADVVLRESVVKAASWAHGVRTGLSPANRNRIWFEMRREVRRARKDRKAEEREAIREWRARKRAAVRMQAQEESAA